MKKFKITESHVRKIVREELKNIILEQMDVPPRGDPQVIAHHVEQGIDPVTYNRTGPPIAQEEQEETLEYCRRESSHIQPPFSYLQEPSSQTDGWQQQASGYVFLSNARCRENSDGWTGWTGSFIDAVEIFFDQLGGMSGASRSQMLDKSIVEYWFANQLLKWDVGFSRRKERILDDVAPPIDWTQDDIEALFEDHHYEAEIDSGAVNPSGAEGLQDWTSWRSLNNFDNPYAEDIFSKIWTANISSHRNKTNPDRLIQLASRLFEKQIEIKGDQSLALIKVYRCAKVYGKFGVARGLLDLVNLDPLGDAGQYCSFAGYTLNPINSNRQRNTFLTH